PLDGAASGRVAVRHGPGRLVLTASHQPGVLVEGAFGGGVTRDVRREAGRVEVRLAPPRRAVGRGRALDWTVALGRRTALAVELELDSSRGELDLSDCRATDLALRARGSDVDLRLPGAGDTHARVEARAGVLRVRVPDRVAARITLRGRPGQVRVDPVRFRARDDRHESPDYEHASRRVDLELDVDGTDVEVR
ncbi:MAG TPA: hypothetical protein VNO17_10385, partial [Actinomycetota bacterium]|nr:hypothetical protein [Actinomycetota bacterium]